MFWSIKKPMKAHLKRLGFWSIMLSPMTIASASYGYLQELETREYSSIDRWETAQFNIQTDPVEDRFPQGTPLPEPLPPEETEQIPTTTPETPVVDPDSPKITIKTIEVIDSSIFDTQDFNSIIQPLSDRTVTLTELQEVADQITQMYLERGYLTSRAVIVEESLTTENIIIRIIEGEIEEIQVEGTKRLNPNYIISRLRLGAGKPLSSAKLEDQLRLLRNDPLIENIEASLKAGSGLGKSILTVKVTENRPFFGSAGFDNYSPPSIGSERFNLELGYRNVTGLGDQAGFIYRRTLQGGKDELDFRYRIPVNAMDGTVQIRTVLEWNNVIQADLKPFDISGDNQLYEISYRQPVIRSPRQELALSLGFTYQDGQTFLGDTGFPFGFGPNPEGETRTSVLKFGQEYVRRDVSGAWAFRSLFNFGLGIFNATDNNDPIPDGNFFSWFGQVQRVQVFNPNNFLIIQADLQLTPDSLLPSQQFVIGGGQSTRGYRQNARAGDNGFRFSLEDRITLSRNAAGQAVFQLAPFLDIGKVWNVSNNPNQLPDQTFLIGLGLGILLQPIPNLNVRIDYAYPFIDLDDRGKNAQEEALYFNVNYSF
jgi:hemolysin activation/secretion protein